MAREKSIHPTNAEFRILQVLWAKGPNSVRAVYEELGEAGGYTSVLKLLQIMLEKGLVTRNDSDRTHVYRAVISEAEAKGSLVHEVIRKAFGGSTKDLIVQALSTKKSSRAELAEIREMIEAMERKKQ
jgi:predicted transcriptional regulator